MYENSPLYLFLGDLHLPAANRMPAFGGNERYMPVHDQVVRIDTHYIDNDEPAMGRIVRDIEYQPRQHSSYDWYSYYLSGDIFEGAEEDLLQFLSKIENFQHRNRIRLIQMGDMYEMWLGLERYFGQVGERSEVEYNRDGAIEGHDITQRVFVREFPYWRSFDPNRRRHFIAFSALRFLAQNDFYIYVMAHTHSPYLTTVNVYVRPGVPAGRALEPSTIMTL